MRIAIILIPYKRARRHRLLDAVDGVDRQALDRPACALALGTTGPEADLAASRSPSQPRGAGRTLASQADLAEGEEPRGITLAAQAALDREQHRQVGRRLADAHAADRVDDTSWSMQRTRRRGGAAPPAASPAGRGPGHREPARVDRRFVHQGLDLDQQRPRALEP